MENDTVIKIEDVSKVYKLYDTPMDRIRETIHPFRKNYHIDFYALNNISFEVKRGETVGIIGKNGSGKSTLLKIITGVLTPTTGFVQINGKISSLLELGAGFNPEYTGIENIFLNGTIMGFSREEMNKRLDDILSFADIGEFVYQPVKTYSSGMFVRLAFATAINVDPDIFIVDEALAVGDVRFQQKCYAKFEAFKKRGKTILFVSHSMESIKRYCTKAIVLEKGKIEQIEVPKEAVNTYLRILRKLNPETKGEESGSVLKEGVNSEKNQLIKIEQSVWYNENECMYGTNEAVFTKVGLYNDNADVVTEFEVGSGISMVFEFEAKEDIDRLYFGFGIRNIQGQDLFVFNGTPGYDDFSIKNVKKGKSYQIRIKHKTFLTPNDYTVALSLVKLENEEMINVQIRYDCLLYKVVDPNRSYAGLFFDKDNISIELLE